jgi:type I restriction enzyme S subunit
MAGEFAETTLGRLLSFANGRSSPERADDLPYPVYGSNGAIGRAAEFNSDPGSIVIGRVGSYCGSLYLSKQRCWVTDNAIRATALDENNPRFLFYLLGTLSLNNWRAGSGQPLLNQEILSRIPAAVPEPAEQRAIAHILGTLDDKIELNRRINETLEAMGQAIFKSWFVDFGPVRAKAEGRDSALPKPLADLFPARLVESEVGEIPDGWEVGRLGDILCQRVERCAASAETTARPYVPIECISPRSLFLTDSKPGNEAQSSLTKFYKGDLLFGAMRPYFHKVCIAPFDGTTRTTAFVLYPKRKDDFAFATFLLHDSETIDFATRHSTGSTIPYAVWVDSMDSMPTILPPSKVRAAFDDAVRPMLARIPQAYFESRTLATLRDTLLPKLISGELRVPDAEKFIERAV